MVRSPGFKAGHKAFSLYQTVGRTSERYDYEGGGKTNVGSARWISTHKLRLMVPLLYSLHQQQNATHMCLLHHTVAAEDRHDIAALPGRLWRLVQQSCR